MPQARRSTRDTVSGHLLRLLLTAFLCFWLPSSVSHATTLTEILVTPAGATMAPGAFRQFFATGVYSDGSRQDITAVAEWTTGDSSTARVSQEPGSRGLVEARDPGTVEIRAALVFGGNKIKGATKLVVDAGPIVALETRPSSKNLDVGLPVQFKARATYGNGYVGDVTDQVAWSSSNPSVARVGPDGVVHPLQVTDSVIIRATHPGTGVSNTDEDGQTRIKAAIGYIAFDEDHLLPNVTILGAGMIASLDVYAYRVDGTRSNITRDCAFEVSGAAGVVRFYTDGEVEGREAGDVEGLANGLVSVGAVDLKRGFATTENAVVGVSGVLVELEVTPDPFEVAVGDQRTTKVFGRLSTGLSTPDLRKVVNWSIGDPTVAVVGTTSEDYGKVTGVSAGETTLWATEPSTGVTSAPATVTVEGAINRVAIEPEEIVLGRGMRLPIRAYGYRDDGSRTNVTGSVQWSVLPAGVATVNADGVIEALAEGTARLQAIRDVGGPNQIVSPEAEIRVGGELVALRVSPGLVKVVVGESRKASVFGELPSGELTSTLRDVVSWSIADTSLALVGNGVDIPDAQDPLDNGEVLGLVAGLTTLAAREPNSGLVSTEVDNLRIQGDVLAVELEDSAGGVVPVDRTVTFKARATFADGSKSVINNRCTWSVDDPTVAYVEDTVPGKGNVTGLQIGGRTAIRISCEGFTDAANIEIAGDIRSLEMNPRRFDGKAQRERQFRVAATYEGGIRGEATEIVTWSSTDPAVASVDDTPGNKGFVRFLADGETLIVAISNDGHVATARVTVTGSIIRLRVVPNTRTIRGSAGRKFKVISETSDGETAVVTRRVVWETSDPEIVRLSDREGEFGILLGGRKRGTATVTATLDGRISADTEITVNALLSGLTVRPDRRRIEVGKHRQVTARGHFDDGSNKSITREVEFLSDDPTIARVVSFGRRPGRVLGLKPGTTTIRAIDPTTGIPSGNATVIEVVLP